jgi:hypothetical protein
MIGAHYEYRPEHYRFSRTQSARTAKARWEAASWPIRLLRAIGYLW